MTIDPPALFSGIHRAGLADGRIGLPELFYRAVYPEKTVVLTIRDNHLIGYKRAIWKLLQKSLDTLYDPPRNRPAAAAELLKYATECRIMTLSESTGGPSPARLGQPRVLEIPPAMIQSAGLTSLVVLPGLGHHFEIWSQRNWQRVKNSVPYNALHGKRAPPDIPA